MRRALLSRGDHVGIVATGFAAPPSALGAGVAALERRGLVPVLFPHVLAVDGYLAGDDAARACDLDAAVCDRALSAIWFARGGYGTARILDCFDLDQLVRRLKLLLGYSDLTALFAALLGRRSTVCLHAPVVAERDALHGRLTAIQIDQAVVNEATKRGLRASAIPDITARARLNFKLVGGVPQALEADGQTARVGKDGYTPMTLAEWVDALVSDAPHLFEANAGGGAAGSGGGAAGNRSGKNPFAQATWNLTEQMKLQKTDPQLAARLEAAA